MQYLGSVFLHQKSPCVHKASCRRIRKGIKLQSILRPHRSLCAVGLAGFPFLVVISASTRHLAADTHCHHRWSALCNLLSCLRISIVSFAISRLLTQLEVTTRSRSTKIPKQITVMRSALKLCSLEEPAFIVVLLLVVSSIR